MLWVSVFIRSTVCAVVEWVVAVPFELTSLSYSSLERDFLLLTGDVMGEALGDAFGDGIRGNAGMVVVVISSLL